MTKLKTTLTISAIASILIIGGFVTATPNAFSTYGGNYDDDDCDHGYYGYNYDDDDCGEDVPKDPCDCEKPDTLKFKFSTPSSEIDSEFRIEIYKKINYIGNEDKKLTSIADVTNMGDYQIESSSFGKEKLNSNTVFAIYKIVENDDDDLVSSIEIHTSCSQDLFIGQTESDNGYSLEITDGLKDGKTSISASNPLTCGDEPEPEKTGMIVIRNALTKDNGGEAMLEDFSYKVTDELGTTFDLVQDSLDSSIHVAEVPKGSYKLNQKIASTVTESYSEVLITGDKKCPATTNESFMIKKDKTVSCTIYNDDNGEGSGGPGGIVFQNNSMEIRLGNTNTLDSCDVFIDGVQKHPCVEILSDNGNIGIVDDELTSTTTIVLFSVVQKDVNPMEGAKDARCELERIIAHNNVQFLMDNFGEAPANPTDNLMVMLECSEMDDDKDHKVNYIMIDPTFGS
ncbi:hypothetical protein [Nitrosopumilus adriaticus]|uniref:DUF7467 domain-containing protein n=1 Tax=Nitrosopumilus adriaticus TaxID=1580092 RepID=UPI00352CA603